MVLEQNSNSKWKGTVLDAVTRIVLSRTCEAKGHSLNGASISIPLYVIVDPNLIRRVMKHKMSFQTMLNDHPPSDPSSVYDLGKLIKKYILEEHSPQNRKVNTDSEVHTNKTRGSY